MTLSRGEWQVLVFIVLHTGGFLACFTLIANRAFVGYTLTVLALLAVAAWRFPVRQGRCRTLVFYGRGAATVIRAVPMGGFRYDGIQRN